MTSGFGKLNFSVLRFETYQHKNQLGHATTQEDSQFTILRRLEGLISFVANRRD